MKPKQLSLFADRLEPETLRKKKKAKLGRYERIKQQLESEDLPCGSTKLIRHSANQYHSAPERRYSRHVAKYK